MISKPLKTYTGGKNGQGVFQAIINQIPPHDVFITAFAGNCGILANKIQAPLANIAIELDAAVSHKWSMIPGITSVNADARSYLLDLIAQFKDSSCKIFIFLDPPYLADVRSTKKPYYKHEMMDPASHEKLVGTMAQLNSINPGIMMMLTHYPCKFYDDRLSQWRAMDIVGRSRKGNTIERLYMNYPEPSQLHDVRFFGENFRQRELLSKAAKNLKRKFSSWTPLEKQYFLYKLNEPSVK